MGGRAGQGDRVESTRLPQANRCSLLGILVKIFCGHRVRQKMKGHSLY